MRASMDVPWASCALERSSAALWLLRGDLWPLRRGKREVTPALQAGSGHTAGPPLQASLATPFCLMCEGTLAAKYVGCLGCRSREHSASPARPHIMLCLGPTN